MQSRPKYHLRDYLLDPFIDNNQILSATLGICSALAVTTTVKTALTMGLCVILVTALSSFCISLIRNFLPTNIRLITEIVIISFFVIIVEQFLKAYFYELSKKLSIFVGLIITNCIVLGRCDSVARFKKPTIAFLDGIGAGLGYLFVIVIIGALREILSNGTFFDFRIIPNCIYATPLSKSLYSNFDIFRLAPGAFFIIGALVAINKFILSKKIKIN
jgi:Na+-transporting NADH:ubiquinone oxidoreductase subunit D